MSVHDTLDNVNLCEKKTVFAKAGILLTWILPNTKVLS